ncbi:hypothetical protein B0H67DRAFT_648030 [Lasiosphaeris hirsuta]|uniref:Uncharacterized protein n=1 Tax=Lasiosphaeris hirsuta TaxID=260670 RepID=A0AA40DLB7_9PEZI|nr:hypothetical protein B0H67DRAFT_648030 [Lasiosphaeris hirsuta]
MALVHHGTVNSPTGHTASPLLSKLPGELRNMIYGCLSHKEVTLGWGSTVRFVRAAGDPEPNDIIALGMTCHFIHMETKYFVNQFHKVHVTVPSPALSLIRGRQIPINHITRLTMDFSQGFTTWNMLLRSLAHQRVAIREIEIADAIYIDLRLPTKASWVGPIDDLLAEASGLGIRDQVQRSMEFHGVTLIELLKKFDETLRVIKICSAIKDQAWMDVITKGTGIKVEFAKVEVV